MPKRRGSEWAVLLTLSLGFFMTLLDLTIVNIAIPDLRRSLHASLAEIGWVINAYIIVLAVLMITAGRLGDLRGRRTLFLSGVAVFSLASAASGLSQNVAELIAARTVQGLGAAMLLPRRWRSSSRSSRATGAGPPWASGAAWPGWPPSPAPPWAARW